MRVEREIVNGLSGHLAIPEGCKGWVVFAHGSGSGRASPRNLQVADELNRAGLGTLLFDLLTPGESGDPRKIFDIPLLASRLGQATRWLLEGQGRQGLPLGYFGASTGAAAALWAAAEPDSRVAAVVSRGGRPDLALERLERVSAPTLLIVGGADPEVIRVNEKALKYLITAELAIVPGATHLFGEPGALDQVAEDARNWFLRCFARRARGMAA